MLKVGAFNGNDFDPVSQPPQPEQEKQQFRYAYYNGFIERISTVNF